MLYNLSFACPICVDGAHSSNMPPGIAISLQVCPEKYAGGKQPCKFIQGSLKLCSYVSRVEIMGLECELEIDTISWCCILLWFSNTGSRFQHFTAFHAVIVVTGFSVFSMTITAIRICIQRKKSKAKYAGKAKYKHRIMSDTERERLPSILPESVTIEVDQATEEQDITEDMLGPVEMEQEALSYAYLGSLINESEELQPESEEIEIEIAEMKDIKQFITKEAESQLGDEEKQQEAETVDPEKERSHSTHLERVTTEVEQPTDKTEDTVEICHTTPRSPMNERIIKMKSKEIDHEELGAESMWTGDRSINEGDNKESISGNDSIAPKQSKILISKSGELDAEYAANLHRSASSASLISQSKELNETEGHPDTDAANLHHRVRSSSLISQSRELIKTDGYSDTFVSSSSLISQSREGNPDTFFVDAGQELNQELW